MKYLLIPIDNIPDKYITPVLVAVAAFKDDRDLKVAVQPEVVFFERKCRLPGLPDG